MPAAPAPLSFWIKAKPGASAERPFKWVELPEGKKALQVSVTAPPEDGKANAAILKRLSSEMGIPKKALTIASGETSRTKRIEVDGAYAQEASLWLKKQGL
jgi:uncharacterized protein (TIGR00251 family)